MQADKFRGNFSSLEKAPVLELKIKRTFLRDILALLSEKQQQQHEKFCNKDGENTEMNYSSHFGLCYFEDQQTEQVREEKQGRTFVWRHQELKLEQKFSLHFSKTGFQCKEYNKIISMSETKNVMVRKF